MRISSRSSLACQSVVHAEELLSCRRNHPGARERLFYVLRSRTVPVPGPFRSRVGRAGGGGSRSGSRSLVPVPVPGRPYSSLSVCVSAAVVQLLFLSPAAVPGVRFLLLVPAGTVLQCQPVPAQLAFLT